MRQALFIVILTIIASAVYSAPTVVPFRGTLKDVSQENETTTTVTTTTTATTTTTKVTPTTVVTATTTVTLTPRVFTNIPESKALGGGVPVVPATGRAPSRSVADAAANAACASSFTMWMDDKNEFPVTTLRCATYTVVYIPSKDGVAPKYFKDEITSIEITDGSTEDLTKAKIKINGDKSQTDLKDSPDKLDAAGGDVGVGGRLLAENTVTTLYSFALKDGKKIDVIVPVDDDNTGYTLSMEGKEIYSGANKGKTGENSGVFSLEDGKLLNNGKVVFSAACTLSYIVPSLLAVFAAFFLM